MLNARKTQLGSNLESKRLYPSILMKAVKNTTQANADSIRKEFEEKDEIMEEILQETDEALAVAA